MNDLRIEYLPISCLTPYDKNARIHDELDVDAIAKSIREFGFLDPIGVWGKHNTIVEGHGRLMAAKRLGMDKVPCIRLENLTDEQRRAYTLAHNRTAEMSSWDFDMLNIELGDILNVDMSDFRFDLLNDDTCDFDDTNSKSMLADAYIVPPFDIFDARQGSWIDRKRAWIEKIGDTGQARSGAKAYRVETIKGGTSILDPVLSEIICRWFTPHSGSKVFDCFAGDTVFGFVSATLGHNFTGIELRQEQVDFNMTRTHGLPCLYICDDGQNVEDHIAARSQDLLFSCPPYYDLEVYSSLNNDASNQETYEDFYKIIENAFTGSIKCLADNRFAVIVCGDVRCKSGGYYNFPNDIINTFRNNGMVLYNNIKLLAPIGTAAFRARGCMRSRKTVHVYQDVLVFYKGDTRKIKDIYPTIEVQIDEGGYEQV